MKIKINIISFASLVILVSCGIQGLYKHTICNIGPVCYAYEFCDGGDFRYRFYHEALGNGTIQGKWLLKGDTIIINTDDLVNSLNSCVKTYRKSDQKGKKIKVFTISTYHDTANYNGPILINNNAWKNTDLTGQILVPDSNVSTISFKNEGNSHYVDTAFMFSDQKINYFEVYLADAGRLNELLATMTKKFIKKGFRLYPVSNVSNVDLKGKIYYSKIRTGCHYFTDK